MGLGKLARKAFYFQEAGKQALNLGELGRKIRI